VEFSFPIHNAFSTSLSLASVVVVVVVVVMVVVVVRWTKQLDGLMDSVLIQNKSHSQSSTLALPKQKLPKQRLALYFERFSPVGVMKEKEETCDHKIPPKFFFQKTIFIQPPQRELMTPS